MNNITRASLISLVLLVSMPLPSIANGYHWDIQQITTDSLDKGFTDVHEGGVVWEGFDFDNNEADIFYWDGSSITNLTPGAGIQGAKPSIYGSTVAWSGNDGIYYWNGATTTKISDKDGNPSLYNGQIAWVHELPLNPNQFELLLWNGTTTQIIDSWTFNPLIGPDGGTSLHDGAIAYEREGGVYYWDGTTITPINPSAQLPSLYNGQIAFEQGFAWVGFWDGSPPDVGICSLCRQPSLYDGSIALVETTTTYITRLGFWDGQDLTSVTELSSVGPYFPSIYGSPLRIAFIDNNQVRLATRVAEPIPTLSQWSLISLLSLLAVFAVAGIHRQQWRS